MAKINVDPDQFADIVMSYLFDKSLNPDDVSIGNEHFNDIMRKLRPRIFPVAREYYLEQPSDMRLKYKLIKKGFRDPKSMNSIFIVPRGKAKEEEPSVIKKIIKRVIKILKSSSEFSTAEVEYIKEHLGDQDDES